MKVAGIDIGSNTSLLLIAQQTKEGFEVLSDKIYFTRLAEGLAFHSQISESAFKRLERAFADMRQTLDKWQVQHFSLVATSASRQAKNKDQLYKLGQKYKLSPIEIISPEREAELTFIGAFFGLGHEFSSPLVVDIGGGSTELVSSKKSWSLNIGSVSLTERFLSPKSVSPSNSKALVSCIQSELEGLKSFLAEDYEALVFTAGTPTTLAFIETQSSDFNQVHGLCLSKDHVDKWLEKLSTLTVEQRKRIPHLPEHRADVIVAGLSLLKEILKATGKKEFIVSATGVRYGLILEQFKKIKRDRLL